MSLYDVAIVGGGIIGLSVGWAITQRHPRAKILLLEKESRWGRHQTGSNSGEIHCRHLLRAGESESGLLSEWQCGAGEVLPGVWYPA